MHGFTYAPNDANEWQHGFSSERDFIYVTRQEFSASDLADLSRRVGPDRTLLVLCSAFHAPPADLRNLTVRKIAKELMQRGDWDRDDYSLAVAPQNNLQADDMWEP